MDKNECDRVGGIVVFQADIAAQFFAVEWQTVHEKIILIGIRNVAFHCELHRKVNQQRAFNMNEIIELVEGLDFLGFARLNGNVSGVPVEKRAVTHNPQPVFYVLKNVIHPGDTSDKV
jgi:hypothetical protein